MSSDSLVVFDVEGVILPKNRFLLSAIGKRGIVPSIKSILLGILYEIGLFPLKSILVRLYKLLEGLSYAELISLFEKIPLMPDVESVFIDLKRRGFKIALISAGIPKIVLQNLGSKLNVDYIVGPEIEIKKGKLTGKIRGAVIEDKGKGIALKKIIRQNQISRCVGVADDRNNLSMFEMCDMTIGYNPDFVLSHKSDYAIKDTLSSIVLLIEGNSAVQKIPLSKNAILRKTIHMSGYFVSIVCLTLISRYIAAILILLVSLAYIVSEIRRLSGFRSLIFSDLTMRASEISEHKEYVLSPIFYALGIVMSLILFPEPLGYVSITVLTLGDGAASVVGRALGKKSVPFNKVKRIEGTLTGFLCAFLGALVFIDPFRALVASMTGMLAEILPIPVNDNLVVPMVTGLVLTFMI